MDASLRKYSHDEDVEILDLASLLKGECLCGWDTESTNQNLKFNKFNKKEQTKDARSGRKVRSSERFSKLQKRKKVECSFVHHQETRDYMEEYRRRKLVALIEKVGTFELHASDVFDKSDTSDKRIEEYVQSLPVVPSPVIPSPVIPSPVIPLPVIPSPVIPSSLVPMIQPLSDDYIASFAYRLSSAPSAGKASYRSHKIEKRKSKTKMAIQGSCILDHTEEEATPGRKELSICHLSAFDEPSLSVKSSSRPSEVLDDETLLQCKKIDNYPRHEIPKEKPRAVIPNKSNEAKPRLTVKNLEVLSVNRAAEMRKLTNSAKQMYTKSYTRATKRAPWQCEATKSSLCSPPKTDLNSVF